MSCGAIKTLLDMMQGATMGCVPVQHIWSQLYMEVRQWYCPFDDWWASAPASVPLNPVCAEA